jgi:hypothetical protein
VEEVAPPALDCGEFWEGPWGEAVEVFFLLGPFVEDSLSERLKGPVEVSEVSPTLRVSRTDYPLFSEVG